MPRYPSNLSNQRRPKNQRSVRRDSARGNTSSAACPRALLEMRQGPLHHIRQASRGSLPNAFLLVRGCSDRTHAKAFRCFRCACRLPSTEQADRSRVRHSACISQATFHRAAHRLFGICKTRSSRRRRLRRAHDEKFCRWMSAVRFASTRSRSRSSLSRRPHPTRS